MREQGSETSFILRRLHSLSGIIPLGAFLFFHFFENASARRGAEAFNEVVLQISKLPYLYLVEVSALLLPLVFHGVYGIIVRTPSRPNALTYGYARNWAFFFQRVSGVVAFLFIGFHVVSTRGWALFVKGAPFTFDDMHNYMLDPGVFLFYLLGVVAVSFHFANGLWSFCITWGVVIARETQRRLALLAMLLFVALSVVGIDIAWTFRTGQSFLTFLGV
jgi:succinate dehydrogenase / fumarate reductase, cytochrome b subunit